MRKKAAKASTPMSATGIKNSLHLWPRASRAAGFTLIETLVVVLIIGLMAAGAIITFGSSRTDSQLERETERIGALIDYAREQAELQTREFGMRVDDRGYQFVVFNAQTEQWGPLEDDDALRLRELPDGIAQRLIVEGREIVLAAPKKIEEHLPQVLLYSSGDVSSFEYLLSREGAEIPIQGRVFTDENGLVTVKLPNDPDDATPTQVTAQ
jgi:general secretion pathway protein H